MQADARGAYYTPAEIVALIVENTLGRLCRETEDVSGLAVLDPACGTGAFLGGASSFLADRCPGALNCIYGADVDEVALEEARIGLRVPSPQLVHGDSLTRINWRRAFPEVMARGGFDAVIGNPPWVSLAGRFGVGAYSPEQIARLRKRFGGNTYLPNTFEFFISLGLELVRPGGYLAFIVPDRLGFNRHFEYLRRRLLTETELLLLVHGIPFPGVVADTMVFVCRKGAPGPDAVTVSRDWAGASTECLQSEMLGRPGCVFARPMDPRIERIVRRMESHSLRLNDICDISSGFGGRSLLISDERVSEEQMPVLKGDSIEAYAVRKTYWFDFRKEHLTGRTCSRARLGASPRILLRKTGPSLVAAYDESDRFPEQSLYFLTNNRTDMDWRFILGILNSRLMNLYYRARCLTNPGTIPHAKKSDLERLPFPALDDRALHDRLADLVSQAMGGEQVQPEIDELVCGLYGVEMEELPR